MNLLCPHLRVLDHFHVVPLYTSPQKNRTVREDATSCAYFTCAHRYATPSLFMCGFDLLCTNSGRIFCHYVPQTLISNSETLVCAIAILAAALSGLWRSRQCFGNVLECPLTFKVLGVLSSLLGHLGSHFTPHASLIPPHLDTSHLTPHASHLTLHMSHHTPHTSPLTPYTLYLAQVKVCGVMCEV